MQTVVWSGLITGGKMTHGPLRLFLGLCAVVAAVGIGQFIPHASAAAAACQTFPQTGKTVCDPFLTYWIANGGPPQQGFPISGGFTEVNPSCGKSSTAQYFERARF